MKALAATYFPGLTYTGRTALWEFAGEMLVKQPWTGYGYRKLLGDAGCCPIRCSPSTAPGNPDHRARPNGYLDIAVMMGIPALCVAVFTFIIEPARDYMRIPHRRENIFLGDFFMMAVLFTTLNAFLESFFFRRADPVWLFVVFAVFGLRLVARFPVKSSST